MINSIISTRGNYNLRTGEPNVPYNKVTYRIQNKPKFQRMLKSNVIVIFVHGMRNTPTGAKMGTNALRLKLRRLGKKYPVIGFSYDSNIRGAHIPSKYDQVLDIASSIAYDNSRILSNFIGDLRNHYNYKGRVILVGHSLGCYVVTGAILSPLGDGNYPIIDEIHLFGSPVEKKFFTFNRSEITRCVVDRIYNYYCPTDAVIKEGVDKNNLKKPSCLNIINTNNVKTKRIYAKDHRFKSYMKALRSFT